MSLRASAHTGVAIRYPRHPQDANAQRAFRHPAQIPICHFNRFSKVVAFRDVSLTRVKPYSEVRTKDLGNSSQGTTSPFSSLFSRNSRVRLEVEVLSRSKIQIMDRSRTAMSLPMERYIKNSSNAFAPRIYEGGAPKGRGEFMFYWTPPGFRFAQPPPLASAGGKIVFISTFSTLPLPVRRSGCFWGCRRGL